MKKADTLLILVLVFGIGMVISMAVHLGSHSDSRNQVALQEPAQVLPVSQ